jgi:hypothetical protein
MISMLRVEMHRMCFSLSNIYPTYSNMTRSCSFPVLLSLKTAHFEIPDSIKHGDKLLCTFPACRASGVKFCFCSCCRVPVITKNKFRVRHHHFGEAPSSVSAASASTSAAVPSASTNLDHSVLFEDSLVLEETRMIWGSAAWSHHRCRVQLPSILSFRDLGSKPCDSP